MPRVIIPPEGGRLVILGESQDDRRCALCGAMAETRPYGPNREEICFDCGMKNKATTERRFDVDVLGIPDPNGDN